MGYSTQHFSYTKHFFIMRNNEDRDIWRATLYVQRVFGSHGNNSSSFYDVRLSPNLSPRSFPNKRDELLAERGDFLWTCRFGARYTSPEIQIRERSERDRNKVVGETNQSRKRFFTCTQCIDCAQPSNAADCRRFFQFFFFLFFPFSI